MVCCFTWLCAGVSGREDEWRYCITDTDSVLGFALGALFVKNAFHGESREKVLCFILLSVTLACLFIYLFIF